MAEKTFPVVIDGNTPTLFVNVEGDGLISIERADGGLVKISVEEAQRLRRELMRAVIYLEIHHTSEENK